MTHKMRSDSFETLRWK